MDEGLNTLHRKKKNTLLRNVTYGLRETAGSFEHGNEHSDSIKAGYLLTSWVTVS